MVQQARLASLGQTAAGVAHEINNPLAFVTNNLVVLKREVSGLHDIVRLYQQAENRLWHEYQRELRAAIREFAEEVDLPFVLDEPRQPARPVAEAACSGSRRSWRTSATSPSSTRPNSRKPTSTRGFGHGRQPDAKPGRPTPGHAGDGPGTAPEAHLLPGQDQPGGAEPDAPTRSTPAPWAARSSSAPDPGGNDDGKGGRDRGGR